MLRLKLFCSNHFEKVFISGLEIIKLWRLGQQCLLCVDVSGLVSRPAEGDTDSAVKEEVTLCWVGKSFCSSEAAAVSAFFTPLTVRESWSLWVIQKNKLLAKINQPKFALLMQAVALPLLAVCLMYLKQPDFS